MASELPPPAGSDEAVALGCTCPRMDNAYGRGYMGIEGYHIYNLNCPVHWAIKAATEAHDA